MKKSKKAPAKADANRERPRHGGSFLRDAETGKLECRERTEAGGVRADRQAEDAVQADGPAGTDADSDNAGSGEQKES